MILVAWVEKRILRSEQVFVTFGQVLSLLPGMIGSYLRSAYYFAILDQCSWEFHIGFGSYLSHRSVSIGPNVAMGSYCVIGTAAIADEVMIASRVSITSGKRQHIDQWGRISSIPRFEKITIGKKTWIGEGAIIAANVGNHCIVAAGGVVTEDTPDGHLIAGNPARPIRKLEQYVVVPTSA